MHPDLPYEQAYFDRALALRDRQQADLARSPRLAANPRAAVELRKRVSGLGLADPDEAIAFGRIEAGESRWYIGKGAIWDDDNELVVVNWQAPIAAPFYTATPEHPEGLDARRLYRCTGNQIREIEDVVFHEVATAISEGRTPEPVLTDALLDSLGGARSGELGDIVATIQASQYQVISRPLDELLVVQGGPGTGKTVVGLHRVSWLLFNRRDRLDPRDVLVVGPNPAFVRYIGSVLPSLGDEAVVQLPVQALGPRVRIGKVDPPEVRRLKGDRRMLRLVLRGLRNRQRVEAVPVELTVDGRQVTLDGRRIATRARQLAGRPHNEGHRMLRAFLVSEVRAALAARPGAPDPGPQGDAWRDLDNYLGRVWPRLTPQAFLVELLSSRRQLLAAGAGTLSEAELELLAMPAGAQVTTWQWSVDDVAVLDATAALLDGVPATYDHIVVDEAQDLSPLQLESIRRRSRAGSMTVLGDLAQATAPWAPTTWEPIVHALRHELVTTELVELEYGYRLPAEVHEVAMRLLPEIAPEMASPRPLRSSGHDIEVVAAADADGLCVSVAATAGALVADGLVGVIVPAELRPAVVSALDDAGMAWAGELRASAEPVVVLTPSEAKGLEFDSVVVVEPAAIADAPDHGVHSLFVALTRCTNRLAIVHTRALPPALGLAPADIAGSRADTHLTAEEAAGLHDPAPGPAVRPDEAAGGRAVTGAPVSWLPEAVAMPVPAADHDVDTVAPDDDDGAQVADAGRGSAAPTETEVDAGPAGNGVVGAPGAEPGHAAGDQAAADEAAADEAARDHAPGAQAAADDAIAATADVAARDHGDQAAAPTADVAARDHGDQAAADLAAADQAAADEAAADEAAADEAAADEASGDEVLRGQAPGDQAEADDATTAAADDTIADDSTATTTTENAAVPEHSGAGLPVAALADRVVVSTPAVDAAVESLGDLDHAVASAVARAVVERVSRVIGPSLLPVVAEQIARAFAERAGTPGTPGTPGIPGTGGAGASAGAGGSTVPDDPGPHGAGAGGSTGADDPAPHGADSPEGGGRPLPETGWEDSRALHRGRWP